MSEKFNFCRRPDKIYWWLTFDKWLLLGLSFLPRYSRLSVFFHTEITGLCTIPGLRQLPTLPNGYGNPPLLLIGFARISGFSRADANGRTTKQTLVKVFCSPFPGTYYVYAFYWYWS